MYHSTSSRLSHLTELMREKTINRVQLAELEDLLQDESNMEEYIRLMSIDSMLAASFDNGGADTMEHLFPHPAQKPVQTTSQSPWFWGGIAAAITLGITGFWILKEAAERTNSNGQIAAQTDPADTDDTPRAFAIAKGGIGLSPADHSLYTNGAALKNTTNILTSGILEVVTPNGSNIIVEAPASFAMKGPNSIQLNYGSMYVDAPSKFESVSIYYNNGYHIRAGKEFAITVSEKLTERPEISSLRGNTLIQSNLSSSPITVSENESIQHLPDGQTQTVPYNGGHYFRHLPQQDLVWTRTYDKGEKVSWISPNDPRYTKIVAFNNSDGQSTNRRYGISQAKSISLDVSGLVWQPGEYRAILKWVSGMDAMIIEKVQLFHDGALVSEDVHLGKTGDHKNTHNHIYRLSIPPEKFQRGDWEIRASVRGALRTDGTLPKWTKGVLYFGSEVSLGASKNDYVGDWEYHFNGKTYIRRFEPNGRVAILHDGGTREGSIGHWKVKNNILHAYFNGSSIEELHMLRDKHTMIFLDQPYNNATKIKSGQ